jgi:hypothetical protein
MDSDITGEILNERALRGVLGLAGRSNTWASLRDGISFMDDQPYMNHSDGVPVLNVVGTIYKTCFNIMC